MAAPTSATPATAADLLVLGTLGRAHGVRGELLFHPFNRDGDGVFELLLPATVQLRREGATRVATLTAVRPMQDRALVRLEGVDSREAAALFTNFELGIPRGDLPALDDGEFYVEDLVGCVVVDQAGQPRGTVVATFWNGGHDVITVRDEAGQELMLPAVPEFLCDVDIEAKRIVIDPHE